jgi:hypothetical protein
MHMKAASLRLSVVAALSVVTFADGVEGGDGGVVGVGEGVEVFLGGGDRGVAHAFFHYLNVCSAGE